MVTKSESDSARLVVFLKEDNYPAIFESD
jgi:hypothetical protein